MKDETDIITAFSEMAPRYEQVVNSELNRFWGWNYLGFVDLILASTPIGKQDIVLDVATGTGVIPYHLEKAGHPSNQIHALDITMPMLERASRRLMKLNDQKQNLVCASAMDMPYAKSDFTQVICGLATHHMDVKKLILECQRVLQTGGRLTVADVGGSSLWKVPGLNLLLRIIVFIYFLINENRSRAWAETKAVSNVLSGDEWNLILLSSGFQNIVIQKLKSRYFWVPALLLIKAEKREGEEHA